MSSIYKSRDPFVRALLRVVEGQVRSAGREHPELKLTDKLARGVAKRVAGKLAADWPRLTALRGIRLIRNAETAPGPKADVRGAGAETSRKVSDSLEVGCQGNRNPSSGAGEPISSSPAPRP